MQRCDNVRHTRHKPVVSCTYCKQDSHKDSSVPMVKCVVDVIRLAALEEFVDQCRGSSKARKYQRVAVSPGGQAGKSPSNRARQT